MGHENKRCLAGHGSRKTDHKKNLYGTQSIWTHSMLHNYINQLRLAENKYFLLSVMG